MYLNKAFFDVNQKSGRHFLPVDTQCQCWLNDFVLFAIENGTSLGDWSLLLATRRKDKFIKKYLFI